jgi:peptidoglycan hydrolase CwlO-like protein
MPSKASVSLSDRFFRLLRRTERIKGKLVDQSNRITELEAEIEKLKKEVANLKKKKPARPKKGK